MNKEFDIESDETMHHSKPFSCKSDAYFVEKINEYRQSVIKAQRKAERLLVFSGKYGMSSKKLYEYVSGCSAGNNNKSFVNALKDFTIEVTEKDCIRKEGQVHSTHQPVNPYFKKEQWSKK